MKTKRLLTFILGWGLLCCGCPLVQAYNIKPLRERCVVKSDGEWYTLYATLYTIEGYPEVQRAVTLALFGKESEQISQGYHQYINSFQAIRPLREAHKTKANEIVLKMQILTSQDRYISVVASSVISGKKIHQERSVHFIWNELWGQMLIASDVFTSPYLEECLSKAGDAPLQFNLDKKGVNWGYETNGKYVNTHVPYNDCDSILTPIFKKLIVLNRLKTRATNLETKELLVSNQAVDEDKVYDLVEQMPKFPGGEVQLSKYLATHGKYTQKLITKDIEGGVEVSFIVEKDGSLTHPQVMQDVNPELAKSVIKTVMDMPKWEPGRQKGVPVRVKRSLTIVINIYRE